MGKVQRQEQLLYEQLMENERLTLAKAMELLRVSESTVRRLFANLVADGRAIRNYGGIQRLPEGTLETYFYDQPPSANILKKQQIAQHAVRFVESGDTLYLDSGSTLLRFSIALAEQMENNTLSEITVITNAMSNVTVLQKCCRIILLGGEFQDSCTDLSGYLAENTLRSLRFSKCFLGSSGYDAGFGFSARDFTLARLNEIALTNAARSYVLMDSSKFGKTTMVSYSQNCPVGTLITEAPPPPAFAESLTLHGTAVEIAPPCAEPTAEAP